MKHRLMIVGIASPLVLIGCAVAILLTGITGWLFLRPEQKPRRFRIATVAPLATTAAGVTAATVAQPEGAPLSAQPGAVEPSPIPPEALATSTAVAEALGFALPVGSVNSVTETGLATRLIIPKLNLDAPVVLASIQNETWQVDHLNQSIGHLEGSAPPGSNSNLVLAGHVTLDTGVDGPFINLGQLAPGDELVVYQGDQAFTYIVDHAQIVERTAIEVTYPSEIGQITLITCTNWSQDEGRYIQRFVVKGHLVTE